MAEISIGSAVGAGFELIARKPLTVMTWGLVRLLFLVGVVALYAPLILSIGAEAMQAQANAGGQPSQAQITQIMSHFVVMQGAGFLVQIVGLFLSAMLFCAVSRSIVHPERGAAAYLRLGAPEFFLAVISFGAGFVIAFALLIGMIPFVIAIAILASQKAFVAMAVVIGLGLLVLLVALIYVALRFAFVVPMMVDDGQFHLFDAWSRTKGHVGSLFVIGLCLTLIALVAEAIVGGVPGRPGRGGAGRVAAGGLQNAAGVLPAEACGDRLAPGALADRLRAAGDPDRRLRDGDLHGALGAGLSRRRAAGACPPRSSRRRRPSRRPSEPSPAAA